MGIIKKPILRKGNIKIKKQIIKIKSEPLKYKIKAIPKRTSTLDELIYSIPDFDKKELRIFKINGKYYDLSKEREEKKVTANYLKLRDLIYNNGKIYNVKDIHTHIGNDPLPSIGDISTAIEFNRHIPNLSSFPISIIDPNTKRICGRTVIYFNKDLKDNFESDSLILKSNKKINFEEQSLEAHIRNAYHDYANENGYITQGINPLTKKLGLVPSKDFIKFHRFQFEYIRSLLHYNIKIQTYPGYRLNRKTMTIEKV
jgi:hypothetical protein